MFISLNAYSELKALESGDMEFGIKGHAFAKTRFTHETHLSFEHLLEQDDPRIVSSIECKSDTLVRNDGTIAECWNLQSRQLHSRIGTFMNHNKLKTLTTNIKFTIDKEGHTHTISVNDIGSSDALIIEIKNQIKSMAFGADRDQKSRTLSASIKSFHDE